MSQELCDYHTGQLLGMRPGEKRLLTEQELKYEMYLIINEIKECSDCLRLI
jgi:hypothetical protein